MPSLNETDDFSSWGYSLKALPVIRWLLVSLITLVPSTFLKKMLLLPFFIAGICQAKKFQIRADTLKILFILGMSTILINGIVPGYWEVESSDEHSVSSCSCLEYCLLKSMALSSLTWLPALIGLCAVSGKLC